MLMSQLTGCPLHAHSFYMFWYLYMISGHAGISFFQLFLGDPEPFQSNLEDIRLIKDLCLTLSPESMYF